MHGCVTGSPSTIDQPQGRTAAEWLESVKEAERRGELLLAVDLAERGLSEHPGDLWLAHRAVLAMARSGSIGEASRRLEEYGLGEVEEEDVAALGARLAKDRALATTGAHRREQARAAAEAYQSIFARTGGYYPAINGATLSLIAGRCEQALALARQVLQLTSEAGAGSYYPLASAAEAHLILGDEPAATESLRLARHAAREDFAALASTRRQLRTICSVTGADHELLNVLSGPIVAHYCGHRIAAAGEIGRFTGEAEGRVARSIASELAGREPGYAYGSLASGGDILWAEALLDRGYELHVILPFAFDEFVRHSVAPSGQTWVQRFHRCAEAAREIRYATSDAFLGDDVLYRYGTELAMGLALLRARYLDAEVRQFALWDGGAAHGEAGTAIDVARWRRTGHPTTIISPDDAGPAAPIEAESACVPSAARRVVRALIFADVRGFSKLTDEQSPRFVEHVLGAFATTLERHAGSIQHQNTWGDALYLVVVDAPAAAGLALALQASMAGIDFEAVGLPPRLALRLGAHLGPVFPTWDPVLGEAAFMGSHVSRTARIEPVTPPGAVYVTEQFAAALALESGAEFGCDYVGHMPAAKDFGRMRMYRLYRRGDCELGLGT